MKSSQFLPEKLDEKVANQQYQPPAAKPVPESTEVPSNPAPISPTPAEPEPPVNGPPVLSVVTPPKPPIPVDPQCDVASSTENHSTSEKDVSRGSEVKTDASANDLRTFINRLMDLLILPSGNMPPQERTLVDDLVTHAITFVPKDHQIRIVERLIAHHATPRALLRHLMHSDEDLSIPILSSSLALSDSDLISVITQKDEEHRKTIAKRDNLPSSVSDALVKFSKSSTLRILLRNEWSRLSRQAFVMLAERSIEEEDIREPLIERTDLPTDLAHLVFWWSDHKLRRRIIDRFTCQRQSILEPIPVSIFATLREGKAEIARTVRMLKRDGSIDPDLVKRALQALEDDKGNLCLDLLAKAAEITPETAAQILDDAGGEPIAVLAKSCGFGRENFFWIRRLMAARQGWTWDAAAAPTDNVSIVYDTLSTDRADVILRYWDRTSREVCEEATSGEGDPDVTNQGSQAHST